MSRLFNGNYLTYDNSCGTLLNFVKKAFSEKEVVDYALHGLDKLFVVVSENRQTNLLMFALDKQEPTSINPNGSIHLYPFYESQLTKAIVNFFTDCPIELLQGLAAPQGENSKRFRKLCTQKKNDESGHSFKSAGEVIYLDYTNSRFFTNGKEHDIFMVGDPQALKQYSLDGTRFQIDRKSMACFKTAQISNIQNKTDTFFLENLVSINDEVAITKYEYRQRQEFRLIYIRNTNAPYYRRILGFTHDPMLFDSITDWAENHNKTSGFNKAMNKPDKFDLIGLTREFTRTLENHNTMMNASKTA